MRSPSDQRGAGILIAERLGDVPLQIAAQYYLAAAAYLPGDYRRTEHLCRKLI